MSRPAGRDGRDEEDGEEPASGHRPQWSGTIGFGIVSIPVRMFSATRDHGIHFHQISRADARRIRYRKVAEGGDDEVPAEDIVKGYRLPNGRYVILEPEELARLAARRSQHLEIEAFVDLKEVDPRHFARAYHLLPSGKQGARPYRLLSEALARSQRAGIAKLVLHNTEHLVAVRSLQGYLSLQTMHFLDELVDPRSLGAIPAAPKVTAKELEIAEQLITGMAVPFDARDYRDEHVLRLRQAIKRKAQGRTLQLDEPESAPDEGKVLDLMEALKRSVARAGGGGRGKRRPPARPPARTRRNAG
jgi:DNA end-binding protein Ku